MFSFSIHDLKNRKKEKKYRFVLGKVGLSCNCVVLCSKEYGSKRCKPGLVLVLVVGCWLLTELITQAGWFILVCFWFSEFEIEIDFYLIIELRL
jgi:hypothetical protein